MWGTHGDGQFLKARVPFFSERERQGEMLERQQKMFEERRRGKTLSCSRCCRSASALRRVWSSALRSDRAASSNVSDLATFTFALDSFVVSSSTLSFSLSLSFSRNWRYSSFFIMSLSCLDEISRPLWSDVTVGP